MLQKRLSLDTQLGLLQLSVSEVSILWFACVRKPTEMFCVCADVSAIISHLHLIVLHYFGRGPYDPNLLQLLKKGCKAEE